MLFDLTVIFLQDDIVKNLRIENEYFQRQLDHMRKEMESAKNTIMGRGQQQPLRTRSLDRHSGHESDGFGCVGMSTMEANIGGYEPQSHLPQPTPHPRFHDMINEEPQQLRAYNQQRDLSSSPNGQNLRRSTSTNKRASNPPTSSGRWTATTTANAKRQPNKKVNPAIDENLHSKSVIIEKSMNIQVD